MKRIVALCGLYILALTVAMEFRENLNHQDALVVSGEESDQEKERGESEEIGKEESGPAEFIAYHLGIRTRSDQDKPAYPANHQWQELKVAQQLAAVRKKSISNARQQSVANGVTAFKERGPGNVPGRTRGILVDPDDATNKTWYVGSASGGIWKTIDGGTSWKWLTPSIPNLATTSLVMASSNHNTIYAGTGEGFGLVDGVIGTGIFKSFDRGDSWNFLSNSIVMGSVNRLAVDPSNENVVLAASNNGIYRSTDGGTTWTLAFTGMVQDLRPTPGNFSTLYATQYGVGVLKSTDGGVTWKISNTGMSPTGRIEIAVSPVNTSRVVASSQGTLSGVNSDLYVSNDGGATWSLVTLKIGTQTVDYLASTAGSQGWYDNTVAFSPYNANVVYVGGIGIYQVTLTGPGTGTAVSYSLAENNTSSFLNLVNFGASADGGKLEVGTSAGTDSVKVLFGPGISQKAHRFLVPVGKTSGVSDTSYTYQDYVDVPFQVWNVTKNQQLMVSFRDQGRNSVFDLLEANTTSTDATQQSREYLFINNVEYNPNAPDPSIAKKGGQVYKEMYFFWPDLATGATWNPTALPSSNLLITYHTISNYTSTVVSAIDPYGAYDGKNNTVHPDQHNIYPMVVNATNKTYQLLIANDGGVFLSGTSASPGTTSGEWHKVGNGYNTSQFYGADKRPGAQEYLGGMQDNSTYFTPSGKVSSSATYFSTNPQLAGDGFEVLWNSNDPKKMIGSSQFDNFSRSLDGGVTWTSAFSGLTLSGNYPDSKKFPFISKLASSKQAPDIIYTVGSEGVWKSVDFGGHWTLTPISSGWGLTYFADVEVSRANANIVWAGAGMYSGSNLFVSADAGKSFTAVPNPSGVVLGNITRIATHPTDQNTAYALFSFAQTAKILVTKDLGATWTDLSGFGSGTSSTNGFPDVAVYCLYVRPDNPNILWAGTEIGIVESLDAGNTWSLLTEFPSVAVWDMKGQDNEIVLATHGRGIWTADVGVDQNANFPVPTIVASGTSPQSRFVVQVQLPIQYDSVQLVINSQTLSFVPTASGTQNLQITNVPAGTVALQLIGYKGNAPIYSLPVNTVMLTLASPQQQYYDYFISAKNFYTNGLSVQSFGTSNSSLQSPHNYAINQEASATLLVPIIVSSGTNTSFTFQDVAIVVPGTAGSVFGQAAFNDYVVVEATRDGVTWNPLANGYNATANTSWLSTYTSKQSAVPSLVVTETFDLKNKFNPGDTLLVRFRLHSTNETLTAWGWSVDDLFIQQVPTGVEPTIVSTPVSVYPNPASGKFYVAYALAARSPVAVSILDSKGRSFAAQDLGEREPGDHQEEVNADALNDGLYFVRIKTTEFDKTVKLVIAKE
jgi:photosystem II stability/assembly factor-like uncharacterized protein